jgi:sulfoxide reductase heme-binding subunit YedZ
MILQINKLRSIILAKLRSIILTVCLLPLLILFIDANLNNLGGNPIEALHIRLGDWTLRFLCITLAITPIQTMTNWRGATEYRQLFGLYTFFYASLHLLVYLVMDQNLQWSLITTDIIESPYIWLGVFAYIIVFLLGISSSKWAMKQLKKKWKKLHRCIYIASIAAVFHYFWQLKGNLAEPLLYLVVILLLLGFRGLVWVKDHKLNRMMIPKGRNENGVSSK